MPTATKSTLPARAKVLGRPTLERDTRSNAVLNRNTSVYKQRVAFKKARASQQADVNALKATALKHEATIAALQAQVAALVAKK